MTEPNFLPGQKADCDKCGTEVTLYPHPEHGAVWRHTAPGKVTKHPIRGIEYDPDALISKENSDEFVGNLVKLAASRGQGRSKVKEEVVAPEVEPHAPSDYSVRATGNCKICRNTATTVVHPETKTPVWVHDKGPVHPEPIRIAHTTVRAPKLTDEEKGLIKQVNIGKPVGDPNTGEVVIPGTTGRHRWDPTRGEVVQVTPGRETETVQSDADYIDAQGNITSRREATLSKASRVDRGVILKGEAHLEKDHPWIAEDSLHPDKQNIETIIHPETGRLIRKNLEAAPRGDLFTTTGAAENAGITEIPVRTTEWKSSGARATVDVQLKKRMQSYIDLAHWHKSTFDKNDQFEYHVYAERPEVGEPKIGVRRRLKYCEKCAPVLLQNGSIPHANTDPSLPRVPNPGQSFVRPEPKELLPATALQSKIRNGKVTTWRNNNVVGTHLIRAVQGAMKQEIAQTGSAKQDGFNLGSGEGK
jgi:hypothetical protein